MASPAVDAPSINGAASSMPRSASPSSINSSTKRKRTDSDSGGSPPELHGSHETKPFVNGLHKQQDQKALIRDYFHVLQRYDADTAVLKLPLPSRATSDEPHAKRQKSEDAASAVTVESKLGQGCYNALDEIFSDIALAVKTLITVSKAEESHGASDALEEKTAKAAVFKAKASELLRRELAYPHVDTAQARKSLAVDGQDGESPMSLMIYSNTGSGRRPLLTSLQRQPPSDDGRGQGTVASLADGSLPNGIYVTRSIPGLSGNDKSARPLTLGELFPSPRNLPPLQPHKPPKSTIKNNVLTFYHPELTSQSKFRSGTYFSQDLSTGQWLDYSNATPSSHIKTKQRQRAQSLAGHKPSTTELEMSEMEALFRGAFSSFAPTRDDSAATISSGQLSHMYWQQWGRRNLQRIIETETPGRGEPDGPAEGPPDVDEALIQEAVDTWDDSVVDPSLSEVMGERRDEDKEVDDLLEEVSDLIETLASYQRNRNLTLPTSQDRHSTDPPNGDMLRGGSVSHQPTDEEMLTYQALKSQLSLIIHSLPPFAVARINSDKLGELNVSTKVQVGAAEYRGVMEEDEPAARARQAAAAAQVSASSQRVPHRAPSVAGGVTYGGHQYGGQYASAGRSPMPNPPHYPQTPARAQPSHAYQRTPSAVPVPQTQARPSPQQPYRTPSGFGSGLAPQLAKSQTPYGHSNKPQYAGQPRMHPQGYPPSMPQATPNARYAAGYSAAYPQQQQAHPQQQVHPQQQAHPQHHAQQRPYPPYANGAAQVPQRTMSPQVPGHPQAYSPSPTPPQQQQQTPRAPAGPPAMPQQAVQQAAQQAAPQAAQQGAPEAAPQAAPQAAQQAGNRSVGITGYHTVMGDAQQQQVMEQARQQAQARQDAHARTLGYSSSTGSPGDAAAFAAAGPAPNVDAQKLAAARANMAGNSAPSPSPRPDSANGAVAPPPPLSASGSPAPLDVFNAPS